MSERTSIFVKPSLSDLQLAPSSVETRTPPPDKPAMRFEPSASTALTAGFSFNDAFVQFAPPSFERQSPDCVPAKIVRSLTANVRTRRLVGNPPSTFTQPSPSLGVTINPFNSVPAKTR